MMLEGLRKAAARGFRTGLVSNAYWAASVKDAVGWPRPIVEVGEAHAALAQIIRASRRGTVAEQAARDLAHLLKRQGRRGEALPL
jgi:hypothetical protein